MDSLCCFSDFQLPYISSERVLVLSEKIFPSELLGVGGLLFELFAIRKSNKKTYETFLKLMNDKQENKSTTLYFQD